MEEIGYEMERDSLYVGGFLFLYHTAAMMLNRYLIL